MKRVKSKNVKLVTLMAERCMSGTELGERVGVTKNTISALLNERRVPSKKTAEAIAAEFGVSIEEVGFDVGSLHESNRWG